MARGVGLDRGGQHVEGFHVAVVAVEVVLHDFHRLELFEPGFLRDLVLAFVGVVLEMSDVGDVAHVAHLVSEPGEVSEQDVERDGGAGMAEVGVAVDGGPADVHADVARLDGREELFGAAQRVVELKRMFFHHGDGGLSVVAYLAGTGSDLAKLRLVFLDVVGEGEEELLGVLGAHDDAAHHGGLGHAGGGEDEVDEEFAAAVADHREVGIFAVGHFGTELDLKLVLVLIVLRICHFDVSF